MIVGYHHTQISVPPGCDEQVRQFYGQTLGLAEIPVPFALQGKSLIWFQVGDRQLHIGVEDNIDRVATRTHLAYEVDDIADFRKRLVAAGFELIEQPKIEHYDRFHIRDPFSNRLEFIGPE